MNTLSIYGFLAFFGVAGLIVLLAVATLCAGLALLVRALRRK